MEDIKRHNFLEPNRDMFLEKINSSFFLYSSANEIIFDALNTACNSYPQKIINILKRILTNQNLTTLLLESTTPKTTLYDKISSISTTWELSEFYSFFAYLLSGNQLSYQNVNEPGAIFVHFKKSTLTGRNIELMRILRNSKGHKFGLKGKRLLTTDRTIPSIEFEEIDELFDKLENMFSWVFSCTFFLIYFVPLHIFL